MFATPEEAMREESGQQEDRKRIMDYQDSKYSGNINMISPQVIHGNGSVHRGGISQEVASGPYQDSHSFQNRMNKYKQDLGNGPQMEYGVFQHHTGPGSGASGLNHMQSKQQLPPKMQQQIQQYHSSQRIQPQLQQYQNVALSQSQPKLQNYNHHTHSGYSQSQSQPSSAVHQSQNQQQKIPFHYQQPMRQQYSHSQPHPEQYQHIPDSRKYSQSQPQQFPIQSIQNYSHSVGERKFLGPANHVVSPQEQQLEQHGGLNPRIGSQQHMALQQQQNLTSNQHMQPRNHQNVEQQQHLSAQQHVSPHRQCSHQSSDLPTFVNPSPIVQGFVPDPLSQQTAQNSSMKDQDAIVSRKLFQNHDVLKLEYLTSEELQNLLQNDDNSQFCMSSVNALIGLFGVSRIGTVNLHEFTSLYKRVKKWRVVYVDNDCNGSFTISVNEYHNSLRELGYLIPPEITERLFDQYAEYINGKKHAKELKFDRFVESLVWLMRLTKVFRKYDDHQDGIATIHFKDFIDTSLYLGKFLSS